MALTDVRRDVLGIVNEVERRLGINESTSLTQTKFTTLLVDFINDVLDECSDYGDWPQMFREWTVTAVSSTGNYELAVSAQVKNISEIVWGDDVASLEVRTVEDMRRLQRLTSYGSPRQFAVVGVSGVNPLFRVYPIPNTTAISAQTSAGGVFDVAGYKKPRLMTATTADSSAVPAFPSRVLSQGVYAKALLEENGGQPTQEYQVAYAEYMRMRKEALNRLTVDTGTDIYITPTGSRYG